jgi:5'-3' exonuclease
MLTNIPTIFRAEEKYICPQEPYWEERYYACLFENNTANQETFTKLVSINYLEGLEWVYKYYTKGCPHWKWKYNYHYPPLLSDLVKYVPQTDDAEFITQNNSKPFSPYAQLCYVLPKEYLNLLPKPMEEHLAKKYSHIYDVSPRLQWAFCKYLWEAHIHNQSIDLATLENIEREIKSL